jgi:methylated-DNA-[protein]-cysteine S-methyltransferase
LLERNTYKLMMISAGNSSNSSNQALQPVAIGMLSSSPIGPLWVALSDMGLMVVDWSMTQSEFTHKLQKRFNMYVVYDKTRTEESLHQLSEYLAGIRRQFTISLDLTRMSPFQSQVLQLTSDIPYGQTSTYKEIAARIGNPRAARAVGRVEATNPIPFIIPCHRVIGSDGSLHGYAGPGGINLKSWLLKLEQA